MSFLGKKNNTVATDLDTSNIIGKGTTITGEVETIGNIRIDGTVIGNINSQAKIALGLTSEIKGHIFAQNAEIAGKVIGNIYVNDVLILKTTAEIKGDIFALKAIVEAGAKIDGKIKVGEEPHQKPSDAHRNQTTEAHGKPKGA
jgi:cytoskeletal protein CcmA (bactofilin family)